VSWYFNGEGERSLPLPDTHKNHADMAGDHILVACSETFRSCTMERVSVQYIRAPGSCKVVAAAVGAVGANASATVTKAGTLKVPGGLEQPAFAGFAPLVVSHTDCDECGGRGAGRA